MKVIIVSAVYPPEPVVSAQTSAQIAQELINQGYLVKVIAPFPNRPAGKLFKGYRRQFIQKEVDDRNFTLLRCFSKFSKQSSLVSRFLENFSFGIVSGLIVLTCDRPSLIYANTWPIVATGLLSIITIIRKIPLIISVQDVYPESLNAQGRIANHNIFARIMKLIDAFIVRRARHIIVISNTFANIYINSRGIEPSHLSVIPNWIDEKMIDMNADTTTIRRKYNISVDAFLIVYGGNVGVAAGVETVIDAIHECKDIDDLRLLVAGSGSQFDNCVQLSKAYSEGRIIFYCPWPKNDTSAVLRSANLLVLPTRGKQTSASVPSKLIAYMMAGKPVIALALPGSETARIISDANCGWVIDPDKPGLLADKIRTIHAFDRRKLERLGKSGREYALKHFSKETCLPKVVNIIREKVNETGAKIF